MLLFVISEFYNLITTCVLYGLDYLKNLCAGFML